MIKTWTELKTLAFDKSLSFQYENQGTQYKIWVEDGNDRYECFIKKDFGSSDQADFEDNYQGDANQSYEQSKISKTKTVTGQATVTGTGQTIVEYTVPEGKIYYITDIIVGGDTIDKKQCKLDSTTKLRIYHGANNSVPCPLNSPIKVTSGKKFSIKNKVAVTGEHTATIIGVLYNE